MRDALENEIEKYLIKKIKSLKGDCVKFSSPGYTGVPDRMIWLKGLPVIFVEVKRPRKGRLSERQKLVIDKMRSYGLEVYVLKNKFEVDELIINLTRRLIYDDFQTS